MSALAGRVAILLCFMMAGLVLSKTKVIRADFAGIISGLLVYVFMPCMTFRTFCTQFTVQYLTEKYLFLLVAGGLLLVSFFVTVSLSRLLGRTPYEKNVLLYSLTVPNTGYVGYALVQAVYGDLALMNMMFFCLPLAAYTYTAGYQLLVPNTDKPLWKRLLTPINVSIVLGAAAGLCGFQAPALIDEILSDASACFAPLGMILIGITVSEFDFKTLLGNWRVYATVALRLLILPICVWLVLLPFQGIDEVKRIAIAAYAMPCGCNTIIFPKLIGEDCRAGVGLVFISTVLCLVTVPFCMMLV